MGKDGYSREGFFGEIIHYDNKGHKIGESWPSFFGGGYNNYDNKGHKINMNIMLTGHPGTGKSESAKWIGRALER